MNLFTKPFQIWQNNGNGQFVFTEFDTLEEALLADKFSSEWYVTTAPAFEIEASKYDPPRLVDKPPGYKAKAEARKEKK